MCGDACLGEIKRRSVLDAALARSEIDIIEGDKFYFKGNVVDVVEFFSSNICSRLSYTHL